MGRLFTSDGRSYEGMDAQTVIKLRLEMGKLTGFITEEEFRIASEAAMAAATPADPNKCKTDWQAEKSKGTPAAIAYLAARLALE